jgi:hypothetical protein
MSVNKKEEKKNLLSRAPQIDPNGEKHKRKVVRSENDEGKHSMIRGAE